MDTKLALLFAPLVLLLAPLGCTAKASLRASADAPKVTENVNASPPPEPVAVAAEAAAQPSASAPPPPLPPGCALVCNNANAFRARLSAADEAKMTEGLAGEVAALRACKDAGRIPTMTLRFDGKGHLTEFGIDPDEAGEGPCFDAVRAHTPPVTFSAAATVRCSERCKR